MEEEIAKARSDMEAALTRIKNTKPGKTTYGIEVLYGNAYSRLVRLGAERKLRGKYRA